MKSIRKFAYAAALTLSAFALAPNMASAQDAAGKFTLSHPVHWQNANIPAGDYKFKVETKGASEMLTLCKISDPAAGYMLLVNDVTPNRMMTNDRLTLVARGGNRYVKEMELPELGVKLNFAVPEADIIATNEVATVSAGSH